MPNLTWGIVCPGPSLALYNTHKAVIQDSPEVLVAVNGAILTAWGFNYWAICDTEVFIYCHDKIKPWDPELALWIPKRWVNDISGTHPLAPAFNNIKKEFFPGSSNEDLASVMPFGKDLAWRERTMFTAIALAILKGAQLIYIYGADMCGKGYYKKGLENYRTRMTDKRWAEERHWYNEIVDACAAEGIAVIRRQTA